MARRAGLKGWASAGAIAAALAAAGAAQAAPSLGEPSLSPDGQSIAFVSGGDIWEAPASGGVAHLLVTNPATEGRPIYSPDGTKLAFTSNRAGSTNIYVLTFATGEVIRLTWADTRETLDGWSRDGKWIYFDSGLNDPGREPNVFRVSNEGGTPLEVSREEYVAEFQAAPSPDGKTLALMARGLSDNQWWRNGHSHIDMTELWLKDLGSGAHRKLIPSGAKHAFPMWSPDGATLSYMSDETGAENLWRIPAAGGAAKPLTSFTTGRVLWPSIAYDGRAIVFERDFGIWKWDAASGQAKPVPITLRGSPAGEGDRHLNETSFREMALSPDGKKVALIAHGEVFAAPTKDGGPAQRITKTAGIESDLTWSADSRRLVFSSEADGDNTLQLYDFGTQKTAPLTKAPGYDRAPAFAPDGKSLAYIHGLDELRVMALGPNGAVQGDRLLFKGAVGESYGAAPQPAWSPDGKWVAFTVMGAKGFRNVYVVEAAGGQARPITFLANASTGSRIAWSPDGTFLIVDTAQRTEDVKLVRVDLLPHVPKYREDAFQELFRAPDQQPDKPSSKPTTPSPARTPAKPADIPATDKDKPQRTADAADAAAKKDDGDEDGEKKGKKPPKPVRIVFDGIRERATLLPLGMSAESPLISPDGKTLVFVAAQGERENLYSYSLDELSREPPSPQQITSTERPKGGDFAFTPDSKAVFYRDGNKLFSSPLESPKPKPLMVSAEMDIDFATEKMAVFQEAWNIQNRRFYDPAFHGKDWVAVRKRFEPQVEGAKTGDELRRIISLMLGELNASHSGIGKGPDPSAPPVAHVGDLGLRFDRAAFEAGKGLVIRDVVTLGPVDVAGGVKPGDRLTAIDGEPIGPHTNLDRLLLGKVGRRTVLSIADEAGHGREVPVRPVTVQVASGLRYRQWVNGRRAYVEKISGGKLGYVHLPDMGAESLNQLYLDLDAQNQTKQGVVIDIRNNHGGFINGYALDVFTRKNYLTMTPRGFDAVPSRAALGQRALGLPTVLVTNESSLSDAEDFSEGYRTLGVGKIVGQPTAGWIIYTGGQQLVDGSTVRTPTTRIQDNRGQTMELNPRPVDITVEKPLGETETGKDAQLEAAVKVLLGG